MATQCVAVWIPCRCSVNYGSKLEDHFIIAIWPARQKELEARIENLEPELERVIQKKDGKYEVPPKLLIYLNIVDHGRAQKP